jgi:hypothetical protein
VSRLPKDRIGKETLKTLGVFILNHRSAHRHHQRDGRINLLLRPLLRWIQVATPICLAHNVAKTPLKHRIAIVTPSSRAQRGIKLDYGGAEVLVVDRNSCIGTPSARRRCDISVLPRVISYAHDLKPAA